MYMLLHKNIILTSASCFAAVSTLLLLGVPAHASMMVKQKPAVGWNRVFEDPISPTMAANLSTAPAGSYVSPTSSRRELAVGSVTALPDTVSTFSFSITGADLHSMELIRYDRPAAEFVTHDPPPLTLAATGLAIVWVCGTAQPGKRRRRRHTKKTTGDLAPAVGFTKEIVEV